MLLWQDLQEQNFNCFLQFCEIMRHQTTEEKHFLSYKWDTNLYIFHEIHIQLSVKRNVCDGIFGDHLVDLFILPPNLSDLLIRCQQLLKMMSNAENTVKYQQ